MVYISKILWSAVMYTSTNHFNQQIMSGHFLFYCRENSPSSPLTHKALTVWSSPCHRPYTHIYDTVTGPAHTATTHCWPVDRSYTTPLVATSNASQATLRANSRPLSRPTQGYSRSSALSLSGRANSSAPGTQRHEFSTQNTRRCHGHSCALLRYAPWYL